MAKLNKLSAEQINRFAEFREEWLRVGLSTERADRARAEAGVVLAYQAAGLKPPAIIIWLDSPMAAAMGAALLSGTVNAGRQVRAQVRAQVHRAGYGQHDAGWLAFYDFFAQAASVGACAPLFGQMEIARSSGWWWPLENAAILTERPTELHRNPEGRLHNDSGPAILYPDGWGIWALNGLPVDQRIVEQPQTLTFAEVRDQPNTEVRRHMLDRFGGLRGSAAAGAWLQDGGLKPISKTDITAKMQPSGLSIWRLSNGEAPVMCKLYRAELPDDEPLVLLWVICTSTAKEVFLRVPPHITDAAEARDWTFPLLKGESLAEAVET